MEKRTIIKIVLISIISIAIIIVSSLYVTDANFRLSIDKIFNRAIYENNLKSIEISAEDSPIVYSYDKYIVVLSKGVLKCYDKTAKNVSSIEVNITSPMMKSNGKYLVIGEKNGKNFCVIYENELLWSNSVEGSISEININDNGYVGVIVTNTTYKSVVIAYNNDGVELFKTYINSTYALNCDISNNNRYLAIGEVDYSGTIIKSKVEIISIDLAKNDPRNSIINSYESEPGEVITSLNYHIGDNVYCVFSNYVQKVNHNGNERIVDFNENTLFADIYTKNSLVLFEKQSSGIFSSEYQIRIINLSTKKENLYFENLKLIKSLKTSGENIVLNFVNSVQVLTKKGWLSKKYTSTKEIKDIVVSEKIVGIVYKDKIEIIEL
ncbi:MAG: hypothetical protein J6J60_06660 [Clostridia bacterium]|nr:hypothetical protein [Clostridia bacterium]